MKKQFIWILAGILILWLLYEKIYHSKVESQVDKVFTEEEAQFQRPAQNQNAIPMHGAPQGTPVEVVK